MVKASGPKKSRHSSDTDGLMSSFDSRYLAAARKGPIMPAWHTRNISTASIIRDGGIDSGASCQTCRVAGMAAARSRNAVQAVTERHLLLSWMSPDRDVHGNGGHQVMLGEVEFSRVGVGK